MAPIKFEEDIKNKLEDRTLQPSEKSWEQLSIRLDQNNKKRISKFWWLAVAALLVIAFQLVFNSNGGYVSEVDQKPVIAEEPVDKTIENLEIDNLDKKDSLPTKLMTEETIAEVDSKDVEPELVVDQTKKRESKIVQSDKIITDDQSSKSKIAFSEVDVSENISEPNSILIAENEMGELLEEIKSSETVNSMDKEVDSLLKAAQKAIILNHAIKNQSNVVDAQNLLMEVETEVEPSLKSKVYKALKGGYQKVKTAVAERNN